MAPFRSFCDLICSILGVGLRTAEVIVAETGGDMTVFPSPKHLASWAGVCPGSNESAGRVKSTQTRPWNPYLKAALGTAALSIAASRGTFLAAKYKRLAARRGGKKALVAIEHTILTAIWSMATTGAQYTTPDPTTTYATTPTGPDATPSDNSNDSATPSPSPETHRPPDAKGIFASECEHAGGPTGNRTQNPRIKSPLLCQLSYRPAPDAVPRALGGLRSRPTLASVVSRRAGALRGPSLAHGRREPRARARAENVGAIATGPREVRSLA